MTRTEEYQRQQFRFLLLDFLSQFTTKLVNGYSIGDTEMVQKSLEAYVNKAMNIQNADAEDNFNPHHAEEQGRPF